MALNVLMHPRNPYRDKRPDFKALAEKYELFREHVKSDSKGKVHVDFKNPACLRALTWALLKDDFQLDVQLPLDRLIPTIPLRLNYILWLEDIFGVSCNSLSGIDIGTGAACIYPLLGSQTRGWHFLATEADPTNVEYATENVIRNGLADKVRVLQVTEDSTLSDAVCKTSNDDTCKYDFCMCNPPFYGSNLEAWGWLTTRGMGPDGQGNRTRPEPSSVSTASPMESIAPGGEVQFVQQRIIESSLELQSQVRVYSTMLGKKTSLSALKDVLRMNGITNIGTTEFCQGKTMRWGLAWSFDNTIVFPKPVSKVVKAQKPRPPLVHTLPTKYTSVSSCAAVIEAFFCDLQVSYVKANVPEADESDEKLSWIMECRSNTWSHQRRKRRQQQREQQTKNSEEAGPDSTTKRGREGDASEAADSECETAAKRARLDAGAISGDECVRLTACVKSVRQTEAFQESADSSADDQGAAVDDLRSRSAGSSDDQQKNDDAGGVSGGEGFLLKCEVTVRRSDADSIALELAWIDGQNRELLHQLLQYFKNRLV